MPVLIYAPNASTEKNLKQILQHLFPNSLRFRDLHDNSLHLVTLIRPPHVDVKIQGLVSLFEFNNPKQHFALVAAAVAANIQKFSWEAHTEKIGDILQAIEASSFVLVHLNGSTFSVTRFRPHPHPQMSSKGFIIATGNGLPSGGIVRVGSGNELYSRLYGHAGRRFMQAGNDALVNGTVNLGVNIATGMVFARLLGFSGLITQAEAGTLWRSFGLARQGTQAATTR